MTEDNETIIDRRIGMRFGHASRGNCFNVARYPASVIVIMDHHVYEDAAGFVFIEEPIARWFFRAITAAVQTEHSGFADLSFGDSGMSQCIFREEANYVCDEELHTRLVTSRDHFLRLLRGAC